MKTHEVYFDIVANIEDRLRTLALKSEIRKSSDNDIFKLSAFCEIEKWPVEVKIDYLAWPRIIRVSFELGSVPELKRHAVCCLLNMLNERLCPSCFKVNLYTGQVTLEAGMFTFESFPEEDQEQYEWPLKGEFHLLFDHLRTAASTYIPIYLEQVKGNSKPESILSKFDKKLKMKKRADLQDLGVELENRDR